jgi:restriction endonuclease-like protein/putative AbiEi antitoxin of type IV toxin-antitoxin system
MSANPIFSTSSVENIDRVVADLAARQHGVVSRGQLLELGLSSRAIQGRIERGALHPLYRGVYAVGHCVVSKRGRWMAAVLAAGRRAVLSHRSAGALWDLGADPAGRVEVSSPTERRRPGIKVYETVLAPDEVTVVDGIPVTTIERTLLDLSAALPRSGVERAIERADALRLVDHAIVGALLERYRGRPGTSLLSELRERGVEPVLTRSELEERFMTFLDAHPMPRPEVNTVVEGFEVDFVWREQRVIVELDSRTWHHTRAAFERDRERDRILQAHGRRVVRITWRQLHDDPQRIAHDLLALTGHRQ